MPDHAHTPSSPGYRRKHRRIACALVVVLLGGWAGSTFVLFVKPDKTQTPRRADAIVMLGGNGERLVRVHQLAQTNSTPTIAISDPRRILEPCSSRPQDALDQLPGKKVICFHPEPTTTRGEARAIGKLAAKHRWRSIIVVVSTDQVTRAKLLIGRCWGGEVQMVAVHPSQPIPWRAVYEWGALTLAVVARRGC
ncbi:MAG: hypothetical protein JWL73_2386 [Actinomycetia bacterium]|nr:hypothetical protein [Actinomycetes bacterium]